MEPNALCKQRSLVCALPLTATRRGGQPRSFLLSFAQLEKAPSLELSSSRLMGGQDPRPARKEEVSDKLLLFQHSGKSPFEPSP